MLVFGADNTFKQQTTQEFFGIQARRNFTWSLKMTEFYPNSVHAISTWFHILYPRKDCHVAISYIRVYISNIKMSNLLRSRGASVTSGSALRVRKRGRLPNHVRFRSLCVKTKLFCDKVPHPASQFRSCQLDEVQNLGLCRVGHYGNQN